MFNRKRLSLARRRRGLTQTQLAQKVQISPPAISGFEKGEFSPNDETLHKIAQVLSFPLDFFSGEDIEEPIADSVSFRALSRMRAPQRDAALTAGAIAFLLNDWVEYKFDLPDTDIPDLRPQSPEAAAASLRQYWRIGERPISNIVHLLEAKGVRVFSLSENCREMDAYSLWRGDRPFVFLNTYKSAEHSRFDGAHELGHLVLHRHGAPNGQEAEKEAQAFASAFLMPEASIRAEANIILPSLPSLMKLKTKWAVSLISLVFRLRRLGILSEWRSRGLYIEIQRRGYRTNEPNSIQRETSQVWDKVFSTLRAKGIGKRKIAQELSISPSELEKLVFGLVIMDVATSSSRPRSVRKKTKKANTLHLVRPDAILSQDGKRS